MRFGRDALAEAPELLPSSYAVLTTERAAGAAPEVVARADSVHLVAAGQVDELAAALRPEVDADVLVAVGGGRVIDTAKALAAAEPPRRAVAIPTTLSGAEMTAVHRHAVGVPAATPRIRPAVVINDPAVSASQPEPDLRASALNALAHAAEALLTPFANPVATLAALNAARLIAGALEEGEPDRDRLALAALLSGYATDSARYGLHHVVFQTLARRGGLDHRHANAIMLPHTLRALARRFPEELENLGDALGGEASAVAARLSAGTGTVRLRDAGVARERLDECADEASQRPELALTPPPADRAELAALYAEAW